MKAIQYFFQFLSLLVTRRNLIFELVRREFASQYIGSWLGVLWTFINPLAMIVIFWFVFGFGLKAQPMNNVPFVVWLTAGMAIWFCFSEIWIGTTSMITNNPHLVQKVVFPTSILVVVKVLCSMVSHAVFLGLLLLLIFLHGLPAGFFFLQFFYYLAYTVVLVMGLGWLSSAVQVFLRDTAQVVQLFQQVGFWGTPIFWDINIMPEQVRFFLKLNPIYYMVQGYRDSFINSVPFWQNWQWALYYWGVAFMVFVFGAFVFRRLRPHFADVL